MIYAVLSRDNFCREFTHFWVENFQASKSACVKKRTNIRYVIEVHSGVSISYTECCLSNDQQFSISDRLSRTWQWIEPKEPQRCNCETDKSKWNGPNGQIHDEAAGSLLRRIDEQQVIINEGGLHRLSDCLMKCLKCMKTFIASWIWFSWLVYELLVKKCKSRRKRCRWIGDYDTKGPPLGIHYANQNAQSRERNVKGKPRTITYKVCCVRADQSNSPNWCFGNYCSSGALRPGLSSIYAS